MQNSTLKAENSFISPLDFSKTVWTNGLWKERFLTVANSTVPQLQHMFESKEISHVVENFRICANETTGDFDGTVFGDGDFYKWMEAAVCAGVATNNAQLLQQLDEYIELIAKAQQPDGYLSTKQIIGERNQNGVARMGDIDDFEVYNFGHMFTSACVYKQLTGKDSFLQIAEKTANYLEKMYDDAKKAGEVQTAVCPSHYMGLMDLYRTTGNEKYLKLAQLAVDLRDSVKNGLDDNQDRLPLKDHDKIIGHAVRANYLYAGVADLCAEKQNEAYSTVLNSVWRSLVDKKMYLTGGCGALYNGASAYGNFFTHQLVHQAYGYEYQLPNVTAYNETCASVGGVLWAWRMFRLEQKAEYFDVLERMMLNTNLAGVSIDGKKFFYENMLRRAKQLDYELVWPLTRTEYILSYCCPPNVARVIAQSAAYAYAFSENTVWAGMYGDNKSSIKLENGTQLTLLQTTDYPWDGKIVFTCENVKNNSPFTLQLRVPAWAENAEILYNGKLVHKHSEIGKGTYYPVEVTNPKTDEITLILEMKPRYTVAHALVEETVNQVAIEYGPLVYCCEGVDAEINTLDDVLLKLNCEYKKEWLDIKGCRVLSLEGEALCVNRNNNPSALYQTLKFNGVSSTKLRFIPYFAWDNRAFGEMRVWLPIAYETL